MKKIRIKISKTGEQTLEVTGAHGDECIEFTRVLEQRLGDPDTRELKPEYDEPARESDDDERDQEMGL
jgi:hypothetical protein